MKNQHKEANKQPQADAFIKILQKRGNTQFCGIKKSYKSFKMNEQTREFSKRLDSLVDEILKMDVKSRKIALQIAMCWLMRECKL